MLGWSARTLSKKADAESDGTIARKDRKAITAIQATLEAGGIEFLGGDAPGVRLHPKALKRNQ